MITGAEWMDFAKSKGLGPEGLEEEVVKAIAIIGEMKMNDSGKSSTSWEIKLENSDILVMSIVRSKEQ